MLIARCGGTREREELLWRCDACHSAPRSEAKAQPALVNTMSVIRARKSICFGDKRSDVRPAPGEGDLLGRIWQVLSVEGAAEVGPGHAEGAEELRDR